MPNASPRRSNVTSMRMREGSQSQIVTLCRMLSNSRTQTMPTMMRAGIHALQMAAMVRRLASMSPVMTANAKATMPMQERMNIGSGASLLAELPARAMATPSTPPTIAEPTMMTTSDFLRPCSKSSAYCTSSL